MIQHRLLLFILSFLLPTLLLAQMPGGQIKRQYGVTFTCNVPTALLSVDGRQLGKVNDTYKLKGGEYRLKVTANGFKPYSKTINVSSTTRSFSVTLEQENCDVSFICKNHHSALLYIDGKESGVADGHTVKLSHGLHTVRIEQPYFYPISEEITIDSHSHSKTFAYSLQFNPVITLNGVTFKMVYVEGGTFQMCGTGEKNTHYKDEEQTHSVTISSFYIAESEVTQSLWQSLMGNNPSWNKGNTRPVENVSWEDVCGQDGNGTDINCFLYKLNHMTGLRFRLPSEAEWEYAARGGSKSRGYRYSGSDNLDSIAWYWGNSGGPMTHEVMTLRPNELGLYDMSGNVSEWCQDKFGRYSPSAQNNHSGPTLGDKRVLRGGAWLHDAIGCRVSCRYSYSPSYRNDFIGLRLALYQNVITDNHSSQQP